MARKYIVTGSHGFIGSHLVRRLGEENCWCIDWKIDRDANRQSDYPIEDGQFDAIFHLAGYIHDGYPPNEILANNVSSTMRVLEEAKRLKAKVIFASSAGVYADLPSPLLEEGNMDYTASPYATSKRIGEELCQLYSRRCGVPAVALRLFNVYGPRGNSVINTWHGSYARAAFIAANELYGFDDVNEGNYKALSEKMAERNKPGIYDHVLCKKCNIRTALTQNDYGLDNRTDYDHDLLMPLMLLDTYAAVNTKKAIELRATVFDADVRSLDDYLGAIRKVLARWKSEGVVGLKMVSQPYGEPDRGRAISLFDSLMSGERAQLPELSPLRSYVTDQMVGMASELGLVVAVHTGVWGDFRTLDPKHMIQTIIRHPGTKFDIYHMGVPFVRDTAIIGKNFPNVWLNLCWCHILSPKMACSAMDELIDLVPVNKIIAFGGDYHRPVEKVYGHLVMARENIARVLGGRVEDGLMTEEEATSIAEMWFYDNPKELYGLRI